MDHNRNNRRIEIEIGIERIDVADRLTGPNISKYGEKGENTNFTNQTKSINRVAELNQIK